MGLCLAIFTTASACSTAADNAEPTDIGPTDSGSPRTGPVDSGATGVSGADGGEADGGPRPDAGDPDPVGTMVSLIRTEVDSNYEYAYEGTKFVPPAGKTLLIVGQTLGGINEHLMSFPGQQRAGGWAAYWGIPSIAGVMDTFLTDTGGRQNHQQLVERFPNTVLQSGLWMVGTWNVARNTANGDYDDVVRAFSTWAKTTGRPIYLRIGYEFDGPHNELDPTDYVNAYRRIVDIMREEEVDNVAFVWHSYASPPYRGLPISSWYPGDAYVDWVGISLFGHMYSRTIAPDLDNVLEFARLRKKPVMIAESSPVLGISPSHIDAWNSWFVNFFSFAYEKNIKAISFINEDWERFNFPGVEWSDARLANNPRIADAWLRETRKDRYLKQSPDLYRSLGYEAPQD